MLDQVCHGVDVHDAGQESRLVSLMEEPCDVDPRVSEVFEALHEREVGLDLCVEEEAGCVG